MSTASFECAHDPVTVAEALKRNNESINVCPDCWDLAVACALRELRGEAMAYRDAVAALAEIDGGSPLSTTIGHLIRSRSLVLYKKGRCS